MEDWEKISGVHKHIYIEVATELYKRPSTIEELGRRMWSPEVVKIAVGDLAGLGLVYRADRNDVYILTDKGLSYYWSSIESKIRTGKLSIKERILRLLDEAPDWGYRESIPVSDFHLSRIGLHENFPLEIALYEYREQGRSEK